MKRIGLLALGLWLVFICDVRSQSYSDSTAYSRAVWSMEKRRMILEFMDLSEAEKACFWPLYESYTNSIEFIEEESLQILAECNQPQSLLNSNELEKLTTKLMDNDLWLAKLRKQFFRKLCKYLSPEQATRFVVLDDTMRQMLRLRVKAGSNSVVHASAQ